MMKWKKNGKWENRENSSVLQVESARSPRRGSCLGWNYDFAEFAVARLPF
jgi:hypothetical protein